MTTDESRSWRHDDSKLPPRPRQEGIPPRAFHSSSSNRRPRGLDKVLKESATNVVREQRKHVSSHNKLKRAAFKEVTSLKTWPLQELALQDLDRLCVVNLGKLQGTSSDLESASDVETLGDSTGLSSSSLDEPKRTRRRDSDDEEDLSPRKSSLRHQFIQDFIRERDSQVLQQDSALPALWCMEPRIFAFEKSATGKRKYIVGHLGRFMDYYWRKCDLQQRHYYELIREKTPCRLYFDLEFSKASNPHISEQDSQLLLNELMEELIHEFKSIYDIYLTKDRIVELDSSTETKFSCHWIVHLPNGELFADATAAGRFVRVFVGRLAEELATGQMKRGALTKCLFVTTASPKREDQLVTTPADDMSSKSCVIDLGVYTRNRLFRIMGSSKFGKPASAALHLASTNEYELPIGNESFYAPALLNKEDAVVNEELVSIAWTQLNSGTSSVAKLCFFLKGEDMKRDLQRFQSSVDWTAHADALAATLVVPMNVMKCNFRILEDSEAAKALADAEPGPPFNSTVVGSSNTRSITNTSVKTGSSPFPVLDNFVLTELATRGGVQGSIRGWSVENDGSIPKSITYQMVRNRWCESIGRPHKSNNIMWTVDFTTMETIQGCHDPECRARRFRGKPKPLSDQLQQEVRDILFDYELMVHADKAEGLRQTKLVSSTPQIEETGLVTRKLPASPDEFDDEEFEKALLALTINEDRTQMTRNATTLPAQDLEKQDISSQMS